MTFTGRKIGEEIVMEVDSVQGLHELKRRRAHAPRALDF
jgi:hypothetical protein